MVLACCGIASAQDTSGVISGTVTDSSGAVVKGAQVELINTDRGVTLRTVTTNDAGFYTAPSLPNGTYTVRVTASGFKTENVTGLILHVNDSLTVNRKISAGGAGETVNVVADELQVNTENAAASGLLTGTQVRELVLSTRNYESLLGLQPGVAYVGTQDQIYPGPSAPGTGTVSTVAFSVNGQRTSANNWTIDGADNVDRGSNLTLLTYPSVEAIAEFRTERGLYSAEYGRSAAGQVNVITRSGTSQYHGNVYEFFRNDYLNANSWANKNQPSPALFIKRPALRYNDFGYTFGGPVPLISRGRDKTFFFWSQEFRRVIAPAPATVLVPTASELAGNFPVAVCTNFNGAAASCKDGGTTTLNPANFSKTAIAYVKDVFGKLPAPNALITEDPHTYHFNARNVINNTQEFVRIDNNIGQKVQIFYRYLHDSLPTQEPFGFGSGASSALPGVQTTSTHSPGTQQMGKVVWSVSPSLLIEGGYAYSYGSIQSVPIGSALPTNSPDVAGALNLPNANQLGVISNVTFTGLTSLTDAGVYNDYNRNHNIFADATKILGKHTVIVGVSYDRYQKTENATGGNLGTFSFTAQTASLPTASQTVPTGATTFNGGPDKVAYHQEYQSIANFLLGTATGGFSQSPTIRIPNIHANTIEAFVQDNWKVTPRLTLNMGVRYSYFAQPTDSAGLLSNFLPSQYVAANAPAIDTTGSVCYTGAACTGVTQNPNTDLLDGMVYVNPANYKVNGHASPYGSKVGVEDKGNVAPRFGFAYDVFGDGKTALRGGYGIAYDALLVGDYEQNAFNNPPVAANSNFSYTSFDSPTTGSPTAAPLPSPLDPYVTAEHFHSPYSQQYSLDMQHQFLGDVLVDIGYYGAHDTHLIGYADINSLAPGAAKAAGILPAGGFATAAQTKTANQIRPYKGYGGMYAVEPIFNSNYNSLQVSVKKRFRGKSEITGNYTWQKNLSNGPIGDRSSAPQNYYNIKAEYGRAAYDRNNFASIDFVWDLPWFHSQRGLVGRVVGGWEISGIIALDSGIPTTATGSQGSGALGGSNTFTDVAGLAISGASPASLRPDQISNPMNGTGNKTKLQWFNPNAFANPSAALGQPGNEKRGAITLPGFNREDVGIFRNFRIYKETNFQLRGEAFNVFNHTNWNAVNTTFTSSAFGQVTGARETRILQIAAKLSF